MPLTPDQIANYSENELRERARRQMLGEKKASTETYVSPRYGDGRHATQPGCLWFNPRDIRPMGDHILVAIDDEPEVQGAVAKPDIARNQERATRTGTVLKVGPGAWKDSKTHKDRDIMKRLPMTLKAGDRVIVGPYSDWESWDADFEGRGANIGVFQEADVRVLIA
jgi:co-chaperonin GroES (HSP10)